MSPLGSSGGPRAVGWASVTVLPELRRAEIGWPFTFTAMFVVSGGDIVWRAQLASQGLTMRYGEARSGSVGMGLSLGVP